MRLIIEHDGTRRSLAVGDRTVRIGRALDNDIHLADARISRNHCRIEPIDGGVRVVDLGSANGLQVNGERTRDAELRPGDELWLGSARILVEVESDDDRHDGLRTELGEVDAALLGLRAVVESARSILGRGTVELADIVDRAIAVLGAERGFLFLIVDGELEPEIARTFDRNDLAEASVRISTAIVARVAAEGRPLLSLDVARDERLNATKSALELGLRSLLAVPVPGADGPIGVLQFDHRLQASVFESEHIEIAAACAALIALALARREDRRRIEAERERARGLAARLEALGASEPTRTERKVEHGDYPEIVGRSATMRNLFRDLDRIVACELPVVVHGESGTGKELVARAIHRKGARAAGPFVSENCAALPDSLLESELFGHARGAFTGADRAKKGLLEQAHGGTLFLDEIGDMSAEMQKKLLRVLQEGELRPVGSTQTVEVDVRLVAASHRDLERMVAEGTFREDLYYRICVLELRLPPLRERADDVPLLARALLERAAAEMKRPVPALSPGALEKLCTHAWPGNVRELENEMRRAVVLGQDVIGADQLSPQIGRASQVDAPAQSAASFRGDLPTVVSAFERRAIEAALERNDGNKSRAAAELGLSRFALQRKLDRYVEDDATAAPDPEDAP